MSSVPKTETNGQPVANEPIDRMLAAEVAPEPPNPFDPKRFRLGQDFASKIGVQKVLTNVPVRKPNKQEFFRVRPGEEWQLQTLLLDDKIGRVTYLVDPSMVAEVGAEVYPACIFLAVTRQQNLILWPAKLPGADGRSNSWNESAIAAAKLAESHWVRMSANMAAGYYDVCQATDELAQPEWPPLSFPKILELGFRGQFITSIDHPVLKQLRGEA